MALSRPISRRISPRWHLPRPGALKLNFDGSGSGNPGMVGVGDVIRNEDGDIILSHSGLVGVS